MRRASEEYTIVGSGSINDEGNPSTVRASRRDGVEEEEEEEEEEEDHRGSDERDWR